MVHREIAHKPDLAFVTDHPNSRAFFGVKPIRNAALCAEPVAAE
jgi:hypothetical protein